jgi:phosphatidylglycerol:prolipoprotein diacylglycerol transferase
VFEYPEFLSPVAFSFLGFGIRWYSLAYISGFLYFYFFLKKHLEYFKLNKKQLDDLFFYIFMSVILGGRLGYVVFYNLSYYLDYPLEILKVWEGGMSFHGALLGIIIGVILFCKKNNSSILIMADLGGLTTPFGIFLGRIANFLNQELVGRKTDFFISIRYPNEEIYRHLSQIYEALLEGFIPFIILTILHFKFKLKSGILGAIFLINYGVVRFLIEFLRQPDVQVGLKFNYFSQGQILSLPMLIGGVVLLTYVFRKKN